jgi:hypothetical protein
LAPTLAGEIALKQFLRQVPVIPSFRDPLQPESRVSIDTRDLNVLEFGPRALPHHSLVRGLWLGKLGVADLVLAAADRQAREVRDRLDRRDNAYVLRITKRVEDPVTEDVLLYNDLIAGSSWAREANQRDGSGRR